jgi:hypothetical protein
MIVASLVEGWFYGGAQSGPSVDRWEKRDPARETNRALSATRREKGGLAVLLFGPSTSMWEGEGREGDDALVE